MLKLYKHKLPFIGDIDGIKGLKDKGSRGVLYLARLGVYPKFITLCNFGRGNCTCREAFYNHNSSNRSEKRSALLQCVGGDVTVPRR